MSESYKINIDIDVNDRSARGLAAAQRRVEGYERTLAQLRRNASRRGADMEVQLNVRDNITRRVQQIERRVRNLTARPHNVHVGLAPGPLNALMGGLDRASRAILNWRTLFLGYLSYQSLDTFLFSPTRLADFYRRAQIGMGLSIRNLGFGNDRDAASFFRQTAAFGIQTPLRMREAIMNAQQLLTFRFGPDEILGAAGPGGERTGERGMLQAILDATIGGGGDQETMHRVVVALGQIRAAGRLNAQDMLQLTNANIRAWDYLAEGLKRDFGIQASLGDIRDMARENLIPPFRAVSYIVEGMRRDFGGMAREVANSTVGGVLSQIADFAEYNIFARFGEGIRVGILPGLRNLNEWLGNNQAAVERWGLTLFRAGEEGAGFVSGVLDGMVRRLDMISRSPAFERASGFERLAMGMRALVVDPFTEWWNRGPSIGVDPDTGAEMFGPSGGERVGQMIGGTIGGAIGGVLTMVLDSALGPAGGEQRGRGFGAAFGQAFFDALNPAALWEKFAQAFWNNTTIGKIIRFLSGENVDIGLFPQGIGGFTPLGQDLLLGVPGRAARDWLRSRGDEEDRGDGPPPPPPGSPGSVFPGAPSILPPGAVPPWLATGGGHPASAQFGSEALRRQFAAAGLTAESVANACGPIAAAGMARAFGVAASDADLALQGMRAGTWDPGVGITNAQRGVQGMLESLGITPEGFQDPDEAFARLRRGEPVIINTPRHYFLGTGVDAQGRINVGPTGEAMANRGGSAWMTFAEIQRVGEGFYGFVGGRPPAGAPRPGGVPGQTVGPLRPEDILGQAGAIAQRHGLDPRVLQAILLTEGALSGQVGDDGQSFGPLQFHRGGMLPYYARARGLSLEEAGEHARRNPLDAIEWAAQGYLGQAIREGQAKGYYGADLATYAQRHGQRSVLPEKAGGNYARTVNIGTINLTAFNASEEEARRLAEGVVEQVGEIMAERLDQVGANTVPAAAGEGGG